MATMLIVATTGPTDATRASLPFHIAVNGADASGVECAVVLAGDATGLLKDDVADGVRGLGVPPLSDLLRACADRGMAFHV